MLLPHICRHCADGPVVSPADLRPAMGLGGVQSTGQRDRAGLRSGCDPSLRTGLAACMRPGGQMPALPAQAFVQYGILAGVGTRPTLKLTAQVLPIINVAVSPSLRATR